LGHHRAQGAIDTVRIAVDAGVTMLDLAPSYGIEHEAEVMAGEALRKPICSGGHHHHQG
jgi:aryl-alcohol dehydrogenase-like predicted oxidoreductase